MRQRSGPFLLPARYVFLLSGLAASGLGAFNLWHEYHAVFVDRNIGLARALGVAVWLAAVILGFLGFRLGLFVAGALAFGQFGVAASTHFEVGAVSMTDFVKLEGLPIVAVDMALLVACITVVISAGVAWTNPKGRNRRIDTLPVLIAALLGATLVILQATDDFGRTDFGSANPEDGAFAAAILAALWLVGGLWIARVRRTGALLIVLATFGIWYSFVTIHLLEGGTSPNAIVAKSGWFWALVGAGAAILAAASFLVSIGLLVWSFVPRKRAATSRASQPVRRGA